MNKLTNCKACGKEIATGVKKCIHCGKDQRNFFLKHKILSGILGLIILGIVITALNGNKSDSTSTSDSKAVSTSEAKEPETKDFYAINEEVKLMDSLIKVTGIEKSAGTEFDKPKDGMEFVIVTVLIKNGGEKEISYNPFDFSMQNSKGQITNEAFTVVNKDTNLNSGSLAAGGEVSGTIAFEQPIGDADLVLKYTNNIFSNKEIKIKLQ